MRKVKKIMLIFSSFSCFCFPLIAHAQTKNDLILAIPSQSIHSEVQNQNKYIVFKEDFPSWSIEDDEAAKSGWEVTVTSVAPSNSVIFLQTTEKPTILGTALIDFSKMPYYDNDSIPLNDQLPIVLLSTTASYGNGNYHIYVPERIVTFETSVLYKFAPLLIYTLSSGP